MWVYRVAPFLCLKALFMMLFIRDLSKSCTRTGYKNQMFEWKLLYGLPSDLMMTVKEVASKFLWRMEPPVWTDLFLT